MPSRILKTADLYCSGHAVFAGRNPFNRSGLMLAEARSKGEMRYAVIDPLLRLPVSGAARDRGQWVPILPGMDWALALGMIRVILNHNRYDAAFLSRPTLDAARRAGEAGFSNAPPLVRLAGKRAGAMLRVSEVSMAANDFQKAYKNDAVVKGRGGRRLPAGACEQAGLFYRGRVELGSGERVEVATALQLLKEEANSRQLGEYAPLCGVPRKSIIDLATRLTSRAKKAAVDVHGRMMSASGVTAAFAVLTLNTLIGHVNARGGLSVGGGFHKPSSRGRATIWRLLTGRARPRAFRPSAAALRTNNPLNSKKSLPPGTIPMPRNIPGIP